MPSAPWGRWGPGARVAAALTILVVAILAGGCTGGASPSGSASPTASSAPASSSPTTRAPDRGAGPEVEPVAGACGERVDPPALSDDLTGVLAGLVEATDLPDGAPYTRYRVVCDNLRATSSVAPADWGDQIPAPGGPPQANLTVGPDLAARVEDGPVVGIGAGRFVGDPPAASFVNENNANGSLENGGRTLPRRGQSVADGCTALEPVAFTLPSHTSTRPGYAGEIQPYARCDGERRAWLVAAAFPDDGGQYQTQLIGQALTTADLEALMRALATLVADSVHVPAQQLPPLPALRSS